VPRRAAARMAGTRRPARPGRLVSAHDEPARPPWSAARRLFRRQPAAFLAAVVLAAAGVGWGADAAWFAAQTWGTPTCSWPLRVTGAHNAAQAGLAGCYVRDLARGDTAGLQAAAAYIPAVRITRADLRYAADARAGLATAAFTQSPVDPTFAWAAITFADGAHEVVGLLNMTAMGGPSGWRLCIGTEVTPQPGPSPAASAPTASQPP
jgi:hypothetical protein